MFSFCLEGFQFAWDFLMAVVFIVQKLAEEWPGLHMCMKTPCRTAGCPAELIWPDMDGTNAMYVCAAPLQAEGWSWVVGMAMLVGLVSFQKPCEISCKTHWALCRPSPDCSSPSPMWW